MNIEEYLNKLKKSIDRALDRYLPPEKERPQVIHKAMRYSVFSGGKRLRPILAAESSKVCGGGMKDILPAACAIELVHTYSLIHDDLPAMDDDDFRRGKPTAHRVFGEANAILAGDALLTLAFNIISKEKNHKIGMEVIKELSGAIGTKGMVGGQVVDLEFFGRHGIKSRKKDIKKIKPLLDYVSRLKTARLFEASAKIGAIVSKAGKAKIKAMAEFGAYLGMAFQIVDDIIDGEGYVKILGLKGARQYSNDSIKKAKCILRIFGNKAERLKDIADYIIERKN